MYGRGADEENATSLKYRTLQLDEGGSLGANATHRMTLATRRAQF
jgi:hypothetical protein